MVQNRILAVEELSSGGKISVTSDVADRMAELNRQSEIALAVSPEFFVGTPSEVIVDLIVLRVIEPSDHR